MRGESAVKSLLRYLPRYPIFPIQHDAEARATARRVFAPIQTRKTAACLAS